MLSNHGLADEALNASNRICDGDPLLVNERGVMAFNHGEFVHVFISGNPILTSPFQIRASCRTLPRVTRPCAGHAELAKVMVYNIPQSGNMLPQAEVSHRASLFKC
jgi:hypothetical protein